jgi:hypothetical protein
MRITVSSLVRSKLVGEQVVSITLAYVPLALILPDQPNRAVRTRMLRGVGGASLSRYELNFFRFAFRLKDLSCSLVLVNFWIWLCVACEMRR